MTTASIDAERALLGSILLTPMHYIAASSLVPEAFSLDSHRRIFRTMGKMFAKSLAIDTVTLCDELQRTKQLNAVGGASYIAELTEGLPRTRNVDAYVKIIHDKAILRQADQAADRMRTRIADSEDPETILGDARAELDELSQQAAAVSLQTISDYMQRSHPDIETFYQRNAKTQGIASGFKDLDDILCGFQRSDLIILAARPSIGKTAIAVNVADHVASKLRRVVAFFSLEMGADKLIDRMACARGQVDLQQHRMGTLSPTAQRYYREALGELLDEQYLLIDETPAQTVAQIGAKAMRAGAELIIVDYLQLMTPASTKENREQQVAGMSRGLKSLAKQMGVPVILLSQLNRELTKRQDKRPMLSDLRESGALEQDADVVLFLHREDYYNADDTNRGKAEVIVAKQRQGPLGTAHIYYQAACTRFANQDPERAGRIF